MKTILGTGYLHLGSIKSFLDCAKFQYAIEVSILKYEDNVKYKDDLKFEEEIKYVNNLKFVGNLKYEDDLKYKNNLKFLWTKFFWQNFVEEFVFTTIFLTKFFGQILLFHQVFLKLSKIIL